MVLRFIDATQAKSGITILIDNEPYVVKSNDISKTGKHGASKCRINADGVFNGKRKVLAVPGHERFDVPNVEKSKAQVLGVTEDKASIMDLETYETVEVPFMEELKGKLVPDQQVECWQIEGKKVIMRIF